MAEQTVVVKSHLGIERDQTAVTGHDGGVDFEERGIGIHESAM